MANEEILNFLQQGSETWNQWREERRREEHPRKAWLDLSGADLRGRNLSGANLAMADLSDIDGSYANLSGAHLYQADLLSARLFRANLSGAIMDRATLHWACLSEANLHGASLIEASLYYAELTRVDLTNAILCRAELWGANLSGANLTNAYLVQALLDKTNLKEATLSGCRIYGVSAWGLQLEGAKQRDLIITPEEEPDITVDNLEVAQFIYLLLNNKKIRDVIDTITSKVVLILGSFTDERKIVLDALRNALRSRNYSPVLFDFQKPFSRDMTETISTLAHLARFVIVDITDARSVPQELQCIVPNLPSVPIQPLLQGSSTEYGMFEDFRRYPWVLEIHRYTDQKGLMESLEQSVIRRCEAKRIQLLKEPPS